MKILFMGRKESAAQVLEWSINNGHEIVGVLTDNHLVGSKTTEIAKKYSIPIYTLEEVYLKIEKNEIDFDLGVSFVYWRILKEPLISFPKYGLINFHPAPLPDYKGTGGYNMAILESLSKWAVSVHYVDAGIDTGGIIDKFEFSIDPEEETVITLEEKSQDFMISLYKKTIRAIDSKGKLSTTPNVGGRYIKRSEMEAMKKILPEDDINKKIRAFWFPPYTGAYIEINDEKFTLINQKILNSLVKPHQTNLIFSHKGKSEK